MFSTSKDKQITLCRGMQPGDLTRNLLYAAVNYSAQLGLRPLAAS
jgi:hypothetical protein